MRNFRSLFVNPFLWFIAFLFFVAAVVGATPATEAANHRSTTAATPAGVDLVKYPLAPKALTGAEAIAKMAELGLRPVPLRYRWCGLNEHREVEGGRFVYECLPPGTIVLVNAAGDQIYLPDCWNRLKWIDERPCPVCAATQKPVPGPGYIRRFWNWLNQPWWVWPYRSHVTIDVAGPSGPYTIDSYGSHRIVVTPRGDGLATFTVYP